MHWDPASQITPYFSLCKLYDLKMKSVCIHSKQHPYQLKYSSSLSVSYTENRSLVKTCTA